MSGERMLNNIGGRDLLADRAYRELQEAIFSSRIAPGASLSVPELARQLEISRSPVREAVQRLVHEGLAVTVPYRGAEVAQVTVYDLQKLFEIREVLEGLAAKRAAERVDASAKVRLEDIVKEHEIVLDRGMGLAAHVEADMRFHRLIRKMSDDAHLAELLETLQGKVRLAMHSLWHTEGAPRLALTEHKKILRAISTGDSSVAETLARAHIARIRNALIAERSKNDGNSKEGDPDLDSHHQPV